MILVLYVLILSSTLEIMCRRRTEEELQFARQLISQQREHYNQTLDYIEQVRIIKHDFRHHIHALLNMDRGERTNYLMNLKRELDMTAEMVFCQNQAVNGLLQELSLIHIYCFRPGPGCHGEGRKAPMHHRQQHL